MLDGMAQSEALQASAVGTVQLGGMLVLILQRALQQTTALSAMLVGMVLRAAPHLNAVMPVHQADTR